MLGRTSSTLLNGSDENRHPYLVPDLKGKAFTLWPLSMMLAVGLSYMAFIMLKNVFYTQYVDCVYHKKGCILSNAFSASIEIITIWSFILLIWCITFIDLHVLNHPCITGKIPACWCCMVFLMCCWIHFSNILLRVVTSVFIRDIGL